MAATMAHEINNPLAAIVNELFIAQTNAESPETVRRCLEVADGELRRVIQITRQSLGFYRESVTSAEVVVTEVMDSTIDLLKNKFKAKHITVDKRYASFPLITGVTGELRQVFANLLANGIDAVENRGIISVRVRSGSLRSGIVCVRITIADNGEGIPNSAVPHVFEPFFTTKKSVGTGLGLWVAKQLVEKHGGSIRLRSRTAGLRRGTLFSIVLPAANAHSDAELTLHQKKKSA